MKQLTCEMCGSTELIKQDGVFICQTCGCKYSTEEAKKMMIEGSVDVSGSTIKVDNNAQVDNFLTLSEKALAVVDKENALLYAQKALELQPTNYKAWIAKMKSINLIEESPKVILEFNEASSHAIEYAPENERDQVANDVYKYQLEQASSLLQQSTNSLEDVEKIKNIFSKFCLISILSASQNTLDVDAPTVGLLNTLAAHAVTLSLTIPDECLAKGDELILLLTQVRDQYRNQLQALKKRLEIYGARRSKDASENDERLYNSINNKIQSAQKLRISFYWETHSEEKFRLTEESDLLNGKILELQKEISSLENQDDIVRLQDQLNELQTKKSSLSFFKVKERKAVQREIDEVSKVLENHREEIAPQIADIQAELSKLDTRSLEIRNQLENPFSNSAE